MLKTNYLIQQNIIEVFIICFKKISKNQSLLRRARDKYVKIITFNIDVFNLYLIFESQNWQKPGIELKLMRHHWI